MKILFVFPYPLGKAASQRFRFEQYLNLLDEHQIDYVLSPYLDESSWKIFYKRGHLFQKALGLMKGFIRRIGLFFSLGTFDVVFIHRESAPIGPPIFEFMVKKIFQKRIIFDFDDAIWLANSSESNRFFAPLKRHANVFTICQWAHKVSVGNEYLANAISSFAKTAVINPTTIDTMGMHNRLKKHIGGIKTIGWTGSHSTIKYLQPIFPILDQLRKTHNFNVLIISDESPGFYSGEYEFIEWNKAHEIEDLLKIDIGIMPLTKDPWSEGKCGFKALQYMALGIPALVSPVGVNEQIVDHGVNGFVCRGPQDWMKNIGTLLDEPLILKEMGEAARKKIELNYSVKSNEANFLHLLNQ